MPFKYEAGWILDPAWTLGRRKKSERKLKFKVLGTFLLYACSCICITNLFLDWWFGEAPSHADLCCAVRRRERRVELLQEARFKSNQMDFERKILPKIVFFHYVGFHSFEAQWIPAENVIIGAVIMEPFCPLYWRIQDAAVVGCRKWYVCCIFTALSSWPLSDKLHYLFLVSNNMFFITCLIANGDVLSIPTTL